MRNLLSALLLAALAGCASAPPQAQSLWGTMHLLAETEQSHAPALWVQPDGRLTAAWIGADDAGVHQDARLISGAQLGDTIILPLPPVHPHNQRLLPARDGKLHLLWQDADAHGEQRLYAALLTPDLTIERGPTLVSNHETLRYTAIVQSGGQILIVWSGGLAAEPALYLQRIDERGLPQTPLLITRDADWPAIAHANDGRQYLFWRQTSDGSLHGSLLENDSLINRETTGSGPRLERGDRLHGLQAALDATHLYLFWNLTRAAGEDESWVMSRRLDDSQWGTTERIGIGDEQDNTLQTGFNSGPAIRTQPGDDWLTWAVPMPGQFDLLPLAGRIGEKLTVLYFQDGALVGYQHITSVRTLIGPPVLLPDRDRYLHLAWAEPLEAGHAALWLTTSRG